LIAGVKFQGSLQSEALGASSEHDLGRLNRHKEGMGKLQQSARFRDKVCYGLCPLKNQYVRTRYPGDGLGEEAFVR
jgi:hypothetical protein